MIEVVSVSLGPSQRDRDFVVGLGGHMVHVRRIGCDGSYARARTAIAEFDGRVAAIGLGGINLAYRLDGLRWTMPGAAALRAAARRTPVCDGSAFKDAVEPQLARTIEPGRGRAALAVSALDRPQIPAALEAQGYRVRVGDPWFGLGLPIFPRPATFRRMARISMPLLRRLPVEAVYGTPREGRIRPTASFDIIWGDIRLIRRRPIDLRGVSIVTSTVRRDDVKWLQRSEVHGVLSPAPIVDGEGFGANVWEAVVTAIQGAPLRPDELGTAFRSLVGRLGWTVPFDDVHPTG